MEGLHPQPAGCSMSIAQIHMEFSFSWVLTLPSTSTLGVEVAAVLGHLIQLKRICLPLLIQLQHALGGGRLGCQIDGLKTGMFKTLPNILNELNIQPLEHIWRLELQHVFISVAKGCVIPVEYNAAFQTAFSNQLYFI